MPWGRVGSNLLVAIVKRATRAKLNNEGLNQLRTPSEQEAWFRNFYELNAARPSRTYIGSKQNLLAIRDLHAFSVLLKTAEVRIIRMRRENVIKTAVSQMRAEHYAQKMREETGSARWALTHDDPILGPVRLDPDIFFRRVGLIDSLQRKLMEAFPNDGVLDIEYEEINTKLRDVVWRVHQHLGIPWGSFEVPYRKATPDRLSDAVENLTELRERLSGTPWEFQFAT